MAYQKKERASREDRGEFAPRRRPAIPANDKIDINDIEVLKRYVTEYGKIIPARVTRLAWQDSWLLPRVQAVDPSLREHSPRG